MFLCILKNCGHLIRVYYVFDPRSIPAQLMSKSQIWHWIQFSSHLKAEYRLLQYIQAVSSLSLSPHISTASFSTVRIKFQNMHQVFKCVLSGHRVTFHFQHNCTKTEIRIQKSEIK